jgi:uncharacterized protein YcfL
MFKYLIIISLFLAGGCSSMQQNQNSDSPNIMIIGGYVLVMPE